MTNNEAKKIINKLNARLNALKSNSENSYEFAIEQLKQISGLEFTKSGKLRTSQKLLNHPHIDKLLGSAENSVPTVTDEMEYIERELAQIDKIRKNKYNTPIPTRDKKNLLSELKAKRYFDIKALRKSTSFEEAYEAWEDHEIPAHMTKRLVNLERRITNKLGKGRKGIKTYAELYQIQILIDAYLNNTEVKNTDEEEEALIESAQLVNEVDLTT